MLKVKGLRWFLGLTLSRQSRNVLFWRGGCELLLKSLGEPEIKKGEAPSKYT
jgi:hypothetical protein